MSTNSLGMRGPREYPMPRPPTGLRIAAVGDSFTFGEGVADDATWPAQLERSLHDTEVMNLGEPAYAHDQMYFALSDVGMRMQPDAVIVGFYIHDLWRDELTFYCSDKPRFSAVLGGWRIDNVPVPTPWVAYDSDRRIPLLYAAPRILIESLLQPSLTDQSGSERAPEALRRMRALTEGAGARFVLVNLPDQPGQPPMRQGFFSTYCARTHAECVDAAPLFSTMAGTTDPEALRTRYQRPHDIHYSSEGYAVVAEALRRYFSEHPLTRAARSGQRANPP
jgi:lysophospholipase L1-like esterase